MSEIDHPDRPDWLETLRREAPGLYRDIIEGIEDGTMSAQEVESWAAAFGSDGWLDEAEGDLDIDEEAP